MGTGQSRMPEGGDQGKGMGTKMRMGAGMVDEGGALGKGRSEKGTGCRMGMQVGREMVIGQKWRCRSLGGGVGVGMETGLGNPGPVGSGGKGGDS